VRIAAAQEAQREAHEPRHHSNELAHTAVETEAQREAKGTHRRSDAEARRETEEARRQSDENLSASIHDNEDEFNRQSGYVLQAPPIDAYDVNGTAEIQSIESGDPNGTSLTVLAGQTSALSVEPAEVLRVPRQYRPIARVPAGPRTTTTTYGEPESRERAAPIEVRLVFEKAGFCRVSLLPRRSPGMPIEFSVIGSGDPPELLALQDEWYQDVLLPDLGRLLKEGIEWTGALPDDRAARLSLSGRDLYVLARHDELNGFVSTPRLVLGEEHVVLCTAGRLPEVSAAIESTESPDPAVLTSDCGIPTGWVGLRGVLPRKPISPSVDSDILNALRPLAEVEIALGGGIRIGRQTWLSGFPPNVRLRGDTSTIGALMIDDHVASLSSGGAYVTPGWDSPGEHFIRCTSTSRTFTIQSGAEQWESWDAYAWSLGESSDVTTQLRPAICGVFVRPPKAARADSRPTVVPASNPVLIGAQPGEIDIGIPRMDVRAGLCVCFPLFEPVWAMPADPLHCDKRASRVLLIGSLLPVAEGVQLPGTQAAGVAPRGRDQGWRVHQWCTAILTASRKGLLPEPTRIDVAELWKGYKRRAKSLRRGWR
jgi:hypothetical protein